MSDLFGDSFGNYMLHGIDEIVVPPPVSWWPQTVGWQLLLSVLLLWLAWQLLRRGQRWWRDRYRRAALAQLTQLEKQSKASGGAALQQLPGLLKATALQAYPRSEVAALHGEDWLAFLDAHYPGPPFASDTGRLLLALAYRPQAVPSPQQCRQLVAMSRRWISRHRAPSVEPPAHA